MGAPSTNFFSKRDFYFIKLAKNWQKWPKMEFFDIFEKSHFLKVIALKPS
jgi:hypothetical protein